MEQRNGRNTAGIRGKDDERKLFVGGLPKQCVEKDIIDTFKSFGEIESVNIKMDPYSGQSRGFCFIVFKDSAVVDQVLQAGEITIHGKKVDPRKVTKTLIPGKLFVGGITPEVSEEKIREYFGNYGKITEIQWPYDKVKNQKRAYLFLTFENRETVTELLRKPKQTVAGVELDVKKVKFNPETMLPPPGMWGGGGGGRGGRGGWAPPYPPHYAAYDYRDDYGYDDYYGMDGDGYYDAYGYDGYGGQYAPGYAAPRAPRGGRNAGGYTRHAPY